MEMAAAERAAKSWRYDRTNVAAFMRAEMRVPRERDLSATGARRGLYGDAAASSMSLVSLKL